MQWIYSILLDVRISSSFGTDGDIRFNLTEGFAYVYTVWKILSFERNSYNIYLVFAMAMRIKGKAGHMSDIMFVCNQFKKPVRPIDAV